MPDNSELAALCAELGDTSWLLGGRRRRRAAEWLAACGTREAAQALAEALVAGADREVVAIAHRALAELTDPAAIDAVCDVLIATGDERLRALITTAGHTHSNPTRRALLLFLGGEFDRYAELDFDGSLLAAAHTTAEEGLRARLAERARESGRVEWVRAIARGQAQLEKLSDREWESAIAVLIAAGHWDQLWHLALEAPPVWGASMLDELGQRDWQPPAETDRAIYHRLSMLAGRARKLPPSSLWTPPFDESVFLEGHRFDGGFAGAITGQPRGYLWEGCCLAVSPDGGLLASGGSDGTVRLWRLPSGAPAGTLTGHTGIVRHLAMSPDGRLLASTSFDILASERQLTGASSSARVTGLRLWRLPSGQPAGTLTGHIGIVKHLAVSPDGRLLASAGVTDPTVRLWRLPSGRRGGTLTGHNAHVTSLVVSPDGRLLASGSKDGTVRLWQLSSGRCVGTLTGHTGEVGDLAVSPDGRLLASASDDKTVRLWRLPSGQLAGTLTGHTGCVRCLAVSPDGGLLASAGWDKTVRFWRLASGQPAGTVTHGHVLSVNALAMSPDGRLLVSGGAEGTVRLWESKLFALSRTQVGKISLAEIERLRSPSGEHPDDARVWVDLITTLVRCRHRFDIEVDAAPEAFEASARDIELDG